MKPQGACELVLIVLMISACLAAGAAAPAAGQVSAIPFGPEAFDALESQLDAETRSADPAIPPPRAYAWLNQIRNYRAMGALILGLPAKARPSTILYAASGSHLAPLVACTLDPGARAYTFIYTETDPAVEGPIGELLQFLSGRGLVRELAAGPELRGKPGAREWRFRMGEHPVALRLLVSAPQAAAPADPFHGLALPGRCDLAIVHDWSGDPIENLRLVLQFLRPLREIKAPPPLLMMEDLEAHPYPVDLQFFSPVARTREPYGHRQALSLPPGYPRNIELGTPLYGGAVLLSFSDPWWRKADGATLDGAFDFLLFNQFDEMRQNVLSGGSDPLLSPAILDWWTGFGTRTIEGSDVREDSGARGRMIAAAGTTLSLLAPPRKSRWACRMVLYRALLEQVALGTDATALMPSARSTRRPSPGAFPSAEMGRQYREATAHSGEYSEGLARLTRLASGLLPSMRVEPYSAACGLCPCGPCGASNPSPEAWKDTYQSLLALLSSH